MSIAEFAACQTFITPDDYASPESFERLLERIGAKLDAARARTRDGSFAHPCLAVFPETIGAFLPLEGNLELARSAMTLDAAISRAAVRRLPSILAAMVRGRTLSTTEGFFLSIAPRVWQIYRSAFARFAVRHQCWVVGGSVLLPRNRNGDLAEEFEPAGHQIHNTAFAFSPEGRIVACTRKVNLVPTIEDELHLSPGSPDELRPFETPFGKVGTLICYDGFNEAHTRNEPGFSRLVDRYDRLGVEILAQPAANPWPWEERWIFAEEGETQLRKEQWLNEGLFAQLSSGEFSSVRYAINPQLLGQIVDSRFDGRSYIFERTARGVRILAQASRADASPDSEEVVLARVQVREETSSERAGAHSARA